MGTGTDGAGEMEDDDGDDGDADDHVGGHGGSVGSGTRAPRHAGLVGPGMCRLHGARSWSSVLGHASRLASTPMPAAANATP